MDILFGLLCFLFGVFVVLAIVAVIGHAIWLMVAAVFGAKPRRVKYDRSPRDAGYRECAGCGEEFLRADDRCPSCGLERVSEAADELQDLEAAARTVQRLLKQGAMSADTCEHIYASIEARQDELLRRRKRETAPDEMNVIDQLEAWFGEDLGKGLSIEEKKEALAIARKLEPDKLRRLSAPVLVGVARLLASVGRMSRACQVYQVLFDRHPRAWTSSEAAFEAIQIACNLGNWPVAERLANIVWDIPGLVESQPELAILIDRVRARDSSAVAAPAVEQGATASENEIAEPTSLALASSPSPQGKGEEAPMVEVALVPEEKTEPAAPRRRLAEWIAVFMEERNILWGELIGGTLIVGCSIALVISLWQTLEQIEFFPFIILAAITSALFGAGFYTLHHWKLESTSRGLLLIGTLLVPLDFLVLAGLTRTSEAGLIDYLLGVAALAIFGWLLYRSSRILVETPLDLPIPSALLITLSMLASAGMQLIALGGLAHSDWQPYFYYPLGLVPVLGQVAAMGWILLRMRSLEQWSIGRLVAMLIGLGSVTFACSVTVCFPLFDAKDLAVVLRHLAPALTLLGVPILIAGTLTHQKLKSEANTDHESIGLWRTFGTGLALAGLFVMFGGFAVSVDDPVLRWLCGAINIGTLLAIAWFLRVPALHVPAQVYLAALVVYGWSADLDALMHEPIIALRLTGLLVVQAIGAEALIRLGRRADGRFYAIGSAVSTVLAGILIAPFATDHPGITAIVLGTASLTWFGANVRWRFTEITYGCALVLGGAIFFAFRHFIDSSLPEQILWSLLMHATICLVASISLRFTSRDWLNNFFRIPLQFASLFATCIVAAILIGEQYRTSLSWPISCVGCCWLAALWLTIAVLEGWPVLFGAFQVVLGAAWIFGAGGWLTSHGWDWREPYSLHVYALGFGALSLGWEISRILTRAQPRAIALLSPTFTPIDRLITGGLIVGQYALTLIVASWSIGKELSLSPDVWQFLREDYYLHAYSLGAWLLPALLAVVLVVWLREYDVALPLLGFTLLLLTIPLLIAGAWFDEQQAAASATRWGLAICFGICSLGLWFRHRLGTQRGDLVPVLAIRAMLIVGAVLPVLFITLNVVVPTLLHQRIPHPLDGVFRWMGGPASLLVPLALVSVTLAGHGFRERLAYYLLAAGLLANISSVGAFFLGLQMREIELGEPWIAVDALLLAAGVAWLWSMVWTWIARLIEQTEEKPLLDSLLLTLNSVLGALLFGFVLLPALDWIMFRNTEPGRLWTQAAGSLWCWLVFGLMSASACCLFWKRRASWPLHLLGALSLTAIGVIACSVEVFSRDDGFLALMFLSGVFACAWVWSNLFLDPEQPPRWLTFTHDLWESVLYAAIAGIVAVILGCATLINDKHAVWSAESIMLPAFACVLLAYQRKTEPWFSLASLLMMLASAILVVHFSQGEINGVIFMRAVHVNLAVLGTMAIGRLGLHRFLAPPSVELSHLWQLPLQLTLGMGINSVVLFFALQSMVFGLDHRELYSEWAWPALVTNAIAAVWYVSQVRRRAVVHAVALCGLLLGVMLAGTADRWLVGAWTAHHVLTLSWTLLGLLLLGVSWVSHTQSALGPQFWAAEQRTQLSDFLRRSFPERTTRAWVTLCGALVVVLALRATWVEPATPYWSVGNTFAVSVLLGALAIWARSPLYAFGSGLLFNVIGLLLFTAWSAHRLNAPGAMLANDEWVSDFVLAQILSFGIAAIVWSLLERKLHGNGIDLSQDIALPYSQFALLAGIHLLAIGVGLANGMHLNGDEVRIGTALAWTSLGVLVIAALLDLWRPELQRCTRFQLYTCGLLAIGLFLHGMSLPIDNWYWAATMCLAGYVLLIVALHRIADASSMLPDIFPQAQKPDASRQWFWNVQLVSIGLVLVLSMWITLTYATWQDRLGGALATSLVMLAALLLVQAWPRLFASEEEASASFGLHHRLFPCYLVLTLGVVIALEISWALLDPTLAVIWLHRNAAALAVVVAATLLYRFVLPAGMWAEPRRSLSALLGPLSVCALVVMLGQELVAYNPDPAVRKTPLQLELVLGAALATLGLAVTAIYSALTKDADLHGIEMERRSVYVYLAELLAVALFAHLRLNVPEIFAGLIGPYWYFVVMVIAFAGLTLSEIFGRKNMPILATPLRRSAMVLAFVPVLAFLLAPLANFSEPIEKVLPGLAPFFGYFKTLSKSTIQQIPAAALCWLLLGIFYGSLARLQKSANYGIFAALAVNFGIWVLLHNQDATTFLHRPQLWLIPLGLIVLVAEFVNRDRLGFWPSLSVRYAGLLCIYLSSTIEMLKELVYSNPIYPIALVLLAVAGMLLGILFRVRAFLLSGFMALLVVVFAQIWNAAVLHSQTWLWWASGIMLGVIILVMFAMFEKHRNGVLKMVDSMKRWN